MEMVIRRDISAIGMSVRAFGFLLLVLLCGWLIGVRWESIREISSQVESFAHTIYYQ